MTTIMTGITNLKLWKIYTNDFDREDFLTELLHIKNHLLITFGKSLI